MLEINKWYGMKQELVLLAQLVVGCCIITETVEIQTGNLFPSKGVLPHSDCDLFSWPFLVPCV